MEGGEHLIHMKTALRPMKILIVAIIIHSRIFMRPGIKRRRVKAKDVLLQTAARMENVPVKFPMRPRFDMFSGGTFVTCLPSPFDTLSVTRMIEIRSIT